jgi:hypothetical protein
VGEGAQDVLGHHNGSVVEGVDHDGVRGL